MFHAQVQNQNYMLGLVPLMQLCDFAALGRHRYGTVDWAWLGATVRHHGMRRVLEAYVHLAVQLLGLRRPSEIFESFRAKLHHRRCLTQLRHPVILSVAWQLGAPLAVLTRPYVSAKYGCSTNPLVINFFRLRVIYDFLRKHRWKAVSRINENRSFGIHRSR
jgi:hypothetical protein